MQPEDYDVPEKLDLPLERGVRVVVLTDEGAVRRGRRRWRPGVTIGVVLKKHTLHDRCWHVRIPFGMTVLLFTDEMEIAP